ncbi:MAG: urate oxidase, partial [Gemmatimonadales bacterium]
MKYEIRYGKAEVRLYRTYGAPLWGVTAIPESPFTGRENTLMAAELEVVVHGTGFLDAYTRGDNRLVVPTDTMKNFMHAATLESTASTLEGWLHHVGSAFLSTYPQMERLTMIGRELPFPAALVPDAGGDGWVTSDVLFARDRNDRSTASLELAREGSEKAKITALAVGRTDLQLIKITGSAFADFPRDEHTTLPERRDRALYVWCDVGWRYTDASDALGTDPARYVAGEQVADLAAS